MPPRKTPTVYVVSDGRGDTASQVVKAAALQFERRRYRTVLHANVRTTDEVIKIAAHAAARHAVIFYTLVTNETREAMRIACAEKLVPAVDVLGPAFSALHDLFKSRRGSTPGLLYRADQERIDRMEAIDYTLKHDDGQRPNELNRADVVLVGVSRASKSSTCFFLAQIGVRAANVPLIPEVPPPAQLLRLPKERVIGLRVNVSRLQTVREARLHGLGLSYEDDYLDKRRLAQEVLQAHRLMDEHGWRSFDVSYLAVEEIAKEVMRLRGMKTAMPW